MVRRDYFLGVCSGSLLSILVVACAGATFPYKYYPYDIQNHKLIGATAADDLDDKVCLPRADNQRPCIIFPSDDAYRAKAEYLKTKDQLNRCEQAQQEKK